MVIKTRDEINEINDVSKPLFIRRRGESAVGKFYGGGA